MADLRHSLILEDNVEGVDDTGNVTEERETNVDQQVAAAAAFEQHTERWQKDRGNELENVGAGKGHDVSCW